MKTKIKPEVVDTGMADGPPPLAQAETWQEVVKRLQEPSNRRAIWQLANTVLPFVALWVLLYLTLSVSIWLTLGLAMIAGLFAVRTFILFHDCGHGSFLSSRRANAIVGTLLEPIVFVAYYHWQWEHWRHHATTGDLDRRGIGDMWTLTVKEYQAASWWTKLRYRLMRNPVLMLTVGPSFMFFIWQRFANKACTEKARRNVFRLNLELLAIAVGMSLLFGVGAYLLIQVTIIAVAGGIGVWMFYVQHQFEGAYWKRSGDWDQIDAALQGSSYYSLPAVLRWFTGSIGFHHIHHLGPRIPNYALRRCHRSHKVFQEVPKLTLWTSLKSCSLRLWDEEKGRLVSFASLEAGRTRSSATH